MFRRRLGFCIIYLLFSIYAVFIQTFQNVELFCLLFTFYPLILFILNILRVKLAVIFEYIFVIFSLFAVGFGSILGFYESIAAWDLLLHIFAGFISILLLLSFYQFFKINLNPLFKYILLFLSSMGLGSLWEMYEYGYDVFFDGNTQKREEGVIDTMNDICIHALGSITCIVVLESANCINGNFSIYLEKKFNEFDDAD